jgi:uncharacterized membrane protein (DUF373 family)
MKKIFQAVDKRLTLSLLGMMTLAVLFATLELGIFLVQELLKPPVMLLNLEKMLEVFGFFLMVLIGVELMETIKAYVFENRVQAEVVLLAAMVAISQKVITLDYEKMTSEHLFWRGSNSLRFGSNLLLGQSRRSAYAARHNGNSIVRTPHTPRQCLGSALES